jgi:hypothetical protein
MTLGLTRVLSKALSHSRDTSIVESYEKYPRWSRAINQMGNPSLSIKTMTELLQRTLLSDLLVSKTGHET